MKYLIITVLLYSLLLTAVSGQCPATPETQINTTCLSLTPYSGTHDVCGYVDNTGREYALVVLRPTTGSKKLAIVDVTDPANPVEITTITLTSPMDVKTHGQYAYVVGDFSTGMAIIDLSDLPNSASFLGYYTAGQTSLGAHNLWIDENGFAYLAGYRINFSAASGVMILDLADPVNPILLATWDNDKFHDVITFNDTLLGSDDPDSSIVILDVSDKSNPIKIAEFTTTDPRPTHNIWYSGGHAFIISTDEIPITGEILIWDISDINNSTVVDRFEISSTYDNLRPHNVAIKNEYAYIAYFQEGLVVLDITCPDAPVIAGHYDPDIPDDGSRMAYPFLPSGNILLAEVNAGLYVIQFDDNSPPLDLNIENQTFTGTDVFRAKRNMVISNVTIEPGSDITFVSGHSITFNPFFDAMLGCNMLAYIDPYCTGSLILQRLQNPAKEQVNDNDLKGKSFTDLSDQLLNNNLRCFPNPFSSVTNIEFSLKKSGKIKLYIKNIYGQLVARLDDGQLHKKGTYRNL